MFVEILPSIDAFIHGYELIQRLPMTFLKSSVEKGQIESLGSLKGCSCVRERVRKCVRSFVRVCVCVCGPIFDSVHEGKSYYETVSRKTFAQNAYLHVAD